MAGILAHMAAGGASGGFQAYGQVMDDNIKAKREAEKEAVIRAREESMARLRHEYGMAENVQSAGLQLENQRTLRGEERDFEKTQKPSMYVLGGLQLTQDQYEALSPEDKLKVETLDTYKGRLTKEERDFELKKENIKNEALLNRMFAKDGLKEDNPTKLKYLEDAALKSLNARISASGGMFDPDSRTIVVKTDKDGNIQDKELLKSIAQSGFEPIVGKDTQKKDRKGLLTGDDYYKTIHLGAFLGGKGLQLEGETQADPGDKTVKTQDQFDRLLSTIQTQGKPDLTKGTSTPLLGGSRERSGGEQTGEEKKTQGNPWSGYTDIKLDGDYYWGKSPSGQMRRMFKVETPTVRYGEKTYPNQKYNEYLEMLKQLDL